MFVSCGPYIWALVGLLVPWARCWYISGCILIGIGINYWDAARDIASDLHETGTTQFVYRLFEQLPEIAIPLVGIYVVIQMAVFWWIIAVKPWRSLRGMEQSNLEER